MFQVGMSIVDECSRLRSMPEPEHDKFWPEIPPGEEPPAEPIELPYTRAALRFRRPSFMGSAADIKVKGHAAQVVSEQPLRQTSQYGSTEHLDAVEYDDEFDSYLVSTRALRKAEEAMARATSHGISVVPIEESDTEVDPVDSNQLPNIQLEGINVDRNRLSSIGENKRPVWEEVTCIVDAVV